MDSARIYATVNQVYDEGRIYLFNNGDDVASRTIRSSDSGDRVSWSLVRSELDEDDNYFVLKGDTSTEPRVCFSNIELVITFNKNDPVLQITKELSSSQVQVDQQVTVTVRIEEYQGRQLYGL